jgi:hypothetical protein
MPRYFFDFTDIGEPLRPMKEWNSSTSITLSIGSLSHGEPHAPSLQGVRTDLCWRCRRRGENLIVSSGCFAEAGNNPPELRQNAYSRPSGSDRLKQTNLAPLKLRVLRLNHALGKGGAWTCIS